MSLTQLIRRANKAWHGVKLGQPDWSPQSHSVAVSVEMQKERHAVYMILNAYWEPLHFELPPVSSGSANPWRRWIDTGLDSPLDIVPWQTAPPIPENRYRAEARSVVVLFAELK
jgi:glycogen operon protein